MNIERGSLVDMADARLNLLREFNLAGQSGEKRWYRFIQLSRQAGFSDLDFQRINANRRLVEQWMHGAGHPPPNQREYYKRVIVGVLLERRYGKNLELDQ